MRITVEPRRAEALKAGFEALADRISLRFEDFSRQLESWDVKAFCDGDLVVGMLMVKGDELHVAVLKEVRGRWLSRRLIREVFAPLLEKYGKARTNVAEGNLVGRDFCERIRSGFSTLEFDPTTALIAAGTQLVGGAIQADAAGRAADKQANAANNATQATLSMFNTQNSQQAPYRDAGNSALNTILYGQNIGRQFGDVGQGSFTHQFNANDLNANLAPNYEFMKQQGLGATTNFKNSAGGAFSGNTLKGITDYAENYASNAYQNAFSNYTANQTNIFNRLSAVAGFGQTANAQSGTLAGAVIPSVSASTQNSGAAQAGGIVGQANAITGGANSALGWYSLSNFMNPPGASQVSEMVPGQFSMGNPQYG